MCLKDDIKFAQNSMNITLSSINDENHDTYGSDSSNFTITLPTHPNTKNYKQALVQLQSLHCPPLTLNPAISNELTEHTNSSVYGVQIDGIGLMNSYISGIPSNIVGVGAPHSAELNSYSNEHSKAGKDVTEYLTHTVTSLDNTTVAESTIHHDGILPNGTSSLSIDHADWVLFQQLGGKIIQQTHDC